MSMTEKLIYKLSALISNTGWDALDHAQNLLYKNEMSKNSDVTSKDVSDAYSIVNSFFDIQDLIRKLAKELKIDLGNNPYKKDTKANIYICGEGRIELDNEEFGELLKEEQ
jgi:hypothetical protein